MGRNVVAAVVALALVGVVGSGATHARYLKKTVNCAQRPYRNTIRGTLSANCLNPAPATPFSILATL
jgi:hypothetical protein